MATSSYAVCRITGACPVTPNEVVVITTIHIQVFVSTLGNPYPHMAITEFPSSGMAVVSTDRHSVGDPTCCTKLDERRNDASLAPFHAARKPPGAGGAGAAAALMSRRARSRARSFPRALSDAVPRSGVQARKASSEFSQRPGAAPQRGEPQAGESGATTRPARRGGDEQGERPGPRRSATIRRCRPSLMNKQSKPSSQ